MCVLIWKCLQVPLFSGLWFLKLLKFLHSEKIDLDIGKHIEPKNMATSAQKDTCNYLCVDRCIYQMSYGTWVFWWDKRLVIYIWFLKYSIKRIISQEAWIQMTLEGIWCKPTFWEATPWTVALQAPLFMEFSRQEYWSGLPCPSPGDLPDPGIEPVSPALQADSLPSEPPGSP